MVTAPEKLGTAIVLKESIDVSLKDSCLRISNLEADRIRSTEPEDLAQELRATIGADGYAVCRVDPFALEKFQRFKITPSSIDRRMRRALCAVSEFIETHMERSPLPLIWADGTDEPSGGPFIEKRSVQSTGNPRVGFPAQLGAIGSGFALFSGQVSAYPVIVSLFPSLHLSNHA